MNSTEIKDDQLLLMKKGIDILDRIEKIEKMKFEIEHLLNVAEELHVTDFSVDDILNYAEKISGTISEQPKYPIMPKTIPYPLHFVDSESIQFDLIQNVGWNEVLNEEEEKENEESDEREKINIDDVGGDDGMSLDESEEEELEDLF